VTSRTELGDLAEGQVLDGIELTLAEAAALNATRLVTVQPVGGAWRVTAAYAVGALRCGELVIRVRPKVGELQVLRLLARAHGLAGLSLDKSLVHVAADPDLTTVLAGLFAQEAATALAAGPLRGYRSEEHTLNVLRGRLRLREQELRRFGQLVPLEVTFDEWTADTDENRRIRAATRRLLALGNLPTAVRDRLLHVDRLLADVRLPPPGAQLSPWIPTRLNLRLHRLLHLADLVLAHSTVEHRAGDVQVHGYVLSMSWLFERLITQLLSERPGLVRVSAQRTSQLDAAGRLTIKPDLVFLDGRTVVAVADTKYKLLDESGRFPNADAYQLITYCARLGLGTGHLIYAAGEPCPEPYLITGAGVQLVVHALDLAQPLPDLERDVAALASRILMRSDETSAVAGEQPCLTST
jgi:5-methylcytosine-specific restriction enzyme subunit McrC